MKSVGVVQQVPIQCLLVAAEQSGKDVIGGVYVVMCNPLYNTPQIVELLDSQHYWLIWQNISDFAKIHSAALIDLGAWTHDLLCIAVQGLVRVVFIEVEELVKQEQVLESEEHATLTKIFFKVKEDALHYMQVLGIYKRRPLREESAACVCFRVCRLLLAGVVPCI